MDVHKNLILFFHWFTLGKAAFDAPHDALTAWTANSWKPSLIPQSDARKGNAIAAVTEKRPAAASARR
jgi:hypothetical protein